MPDDVEISLSPGYSLEEVLDFLATPIVTGHYRHLETVAHEARHRIPLGAMSSEPAPQVPKYLDELEADPEEFPF
jgi:hypothetical protein